MRETTRYLLGILTVLPLLVPPFFELRRRPEEWKALERYPVSDEAVLEIGTRRAARGWQLLGPYSRFGWSHPGPAFFYAAAPLYLLLAESSLALNFTALLINLAAILAMLASLSRLARSERSFGAFTLLFMLYLIYLQSDPTFGFANPWNPSVIILPFTSLFFLLAELALGRISVLPGAVLCASFVAQTHVACLPAVLAMGLASGALSVSGGLRKKLGLRTLELHGRRPGFWAALAVFFFVVMWLPPAWDELSSRPGNLTRLFEFFSGSPERLGLLRNLADPKLPISPLAIFFIVLALSLGYVNARRLREDGTMVLCLLGSVGALAVLWSLGQIVGPVYSHLVLWSSGILVAVASVAALALAPGMMEGIRASSLPNRRRRAAIVLTLGTALTLVNGSQALKDREGLERHIDHNKANVLYRRLRAFLDDRGTAKPLIRIHDQDAWTVAAGVILQLYKARIPFSVEEDWLPMFGREFAASGDEDVEVFFHDRSAKEWDGQYGDLEITRHRGTVIYLRKPQS